LYGGYKRDTARLCRAAVAPLLPGASRAAIDRQLLPSGPAAANPLHAAVADDSCRDRQTDTVPFHRPCSAYNASSVNNIQFISVYVHAWLHYRIPLTWAAAAAGNGQVCRTIITGQIAHSTSCYSNGSERWHCCHCTNRFIIFAKLRQRAPQSNTWLIRWANASMPPPNGISVGSAVFARLTVVTGRQTDRPRHGVCSNRPQLQTDHATASVALGRSYRQTTPRRL